MKNTCSLKESTSVPCRWLDVSVADLTSIRYWVVYLQVIQEAVWPGGVLPAAAEPERSQQQKELTKQRALESLMRLVPGLTRRSPNICRPAWDTASVSSKGACLSVRLSADAVSELLGSEPHRLSWQTVLDSFQDPLINR